jgi:periplasmic protein CpxP/Spy
MRARLVTLCLLAGSASLAAQGRGAGQQQAPPRPPMAGDSVRPTRADLEQQVRERIAKVTKERLGLTDQQMAKLQATNKKFDEQRRLVVDQERDIRMSLRDEMLRPDSARQGQVAALLDRVTKTQRQRVDIQEQEQKELSGFLTPLQRAKYFGLEQQIRQRVNQLRQAQMRQGQMPMGRGGRMGRGQPMPMMQPGQGRGRGVQPPPNP